MFGSSKAPKLGPKSGSEAMKIGREKGTRNEEAWNFVFSEKWVDSTSVPLRGPGLPGRGVGGMDKSIPGGMASRDSKAMFEEGPYTT